MARYHSDMFKRRTSLFPVWAVLFSAVAYLFPSLFAPLQPAIVWLFGVVIKTLLFRIH